MTLSTEFLRRIHLEKRVILADCIYFTAGFDSTYHITKKISPFERLLALLFGEVGKQHLLPHYHGSDPNHGQSAAYATCGCRRSTPAIRQTVACGTIRRRRSASGGGKWQRIGHTMADDDGRLVTRCRCCDNMHNIRS